MILNIWLPFGNEKVFLRTGLIYDPVILANFGINNKLKIPIQLEYIYPKSKIRPKIAFGTNVNTPLYHTVGAMAGFDFHINNKMTWSFNYDFDFIPTELVAIIPKPYLLYANASTGIKITL